MNLDVYDLCSENLQQKLIPMRDRFKEIEDKKTEELQKVIVNNTHTVYITHVIHIQCILHM
jgi:ubiquitin carboxyl-terminal hydrolase 14